MDPDDCLNVLEQRPGWAIITTNIAWCFACPEPETVPAIVTKLQHALEALASTFPWIAGQVINKGSDPPTKNTVVFKIVPKESAPQIVVKDHRQTPSVPSIHDLRQAGFAMKSLDQANIIFGGLILVFSGNHSVTDMTGLAQIVQWFDTACHNEAFTPEELWVGNMPRRHLIPLLDSNYQPGDEVSLQMTPATSIARPHQKSDSETEQPCLRWETFSFRSTTIGELKARATATKTAAYVSTNDSLSAFLWQALARVRIQRLGADRTPTVARACNARRFLGIPSTYPGLVQNTIYSKLSLGELVELPLGAVASVLRDPITSDSPSVGFYTRAVATVLSRSADKGCLKVAAWLDRSSDILLTSCIATEAYKQDFGLGLGPAEAVRLTDLKAFEGMTFCLPTEPSGEVTVAMCLREEDLVRLRADELFAQYGRYRG